MHVTTMATNGPDNKGTGIKDGTVNQMSTQMFTKTDLGL